MDKQENMQEYVVRKLNQPYYNISKIADETKMNVLTAYNIRDGKGANYRKIQALYDFFKSIAD